MRAIEWNRTIATSRENWRKPLFDAREQTSGSLKYVIVEVKADNQIEDAVVQAKKDFAQQIAVASGMEYRIIKSTDADQRRYRVLM